jgi:UDP-N-acetylglucosamine--N-acetylmuramyl-(pentapeptide) pyrophosphoryl-undecaprenol N-acetylglucosamine transferase
MLFVSTKVVDQHAVRDAACMEVVSLPAIGLKRGGAIKFLKAFIRSYNVSKRIFRARPPKAALAMGGFASAPPILAARRFGVQTFLHESNTIPGRANRWLSRIVDGAFIGFPSAAAKLHSRHVTVTGTPVRSQFKARDAASCRLAFGLAPAREVILVMGGSQGASGINELVRQALPQFTSRAPEVQWLHLAGPHDSEKLRQAYDAVKLTGVVQPFCDKMELALGAATVALARAGASSLAEFAAMRVPAILIPYPLATDNHQFYNARAFEEAGAARLFEQATVTPEILVSSLLELVGNVALREKMRQALVAMEAPHAAQQIAQAILAAVRESNPATVVAASPGSTPGQRRYSAIA